VVADRHDAIADGAEALLIDLLLVAHQERQGGGELPRLDPAGEIDLLGGGEERDLPDLLEVHAYRVVGRSLEEVDLDPHVCGGIRLLPRDLDDLDALAAQMLLDLREELLHLLGGEVVDGNRLEKVLGGDESPLASASGDRFLRFLQAQVADRLRQRCSFGCLGDASVYETNSNGNRPIATISIRT
jgi:hypothetical protein